MHLSAIKEFMLGQARTFAGNNTHSGTNTFSGLVHLTGKVGVQPHEVINTSQFTLRTSAHGGKVILVTSAAGSRHKRIVLPKTSLVSSGVQFTIVNGLVTPSSKGITIITSAAMKLNNSSRPLQGTTRLVSGGSITIVKLNNAYWVTSRDGGPAIASSLVWIVL